MASRTRPSLKPGRVYRTADFGAWTSNAPRLVRRLASTGELEPLGRGLYAAPGKSRFGDVPPSEEALLRALLHGTPFVITGPERWNALGLGTTALFPACLVYNTKRSGDFDFGGRPFRLRRVAFPKKPPREWFVVDLFENSGAVGASREDLAAALGRAVTAGRFDRERLMEMADRYGTRGTLRLVRAVLDAGVA